MLIAEWTEVCGYVTTDVRGDGGSCWDAYCIFSLSFTLFQVPMLENVAGNRVAEVKLTPAAIDHLAVRSKEHCPVGLFGGGEKMVLLQGCLTFWARSSLIRGQEWVAITW